MTYKLDISKNNNSQNINSNYLKCFKWNYVDEDNHLLMEEKYKNIAIKNSDIKNSLLKQIKDINLKEIYKENLGQDEEQNNIGPLSDVKNFIEKTYDLFHVEEDVKESKRIKLEQYAFKCREIKKDENSFFRALIFYFLEYIILFNNRMQMIELLILFNEKISKSNPKIHNKDYIIEKVEKIENAEKDNILQIFVIIIEHMYEEQININDELSPYKILLKAFLKCKEFDYGIIFFTRYLMYEFILENENKIYLKSGNIKIGNLINQKKYVKINENDELIYLFEEFYQELMSMGECSDLTIEKSLAPYIFNCNLNILAYDKEREIFKEEKKKCGIIKEKEINLLLIGNFYHIYYKEYYYTRFNNQMDLSVNEFKNGIRKIFNSENTNCKLFNLSSSQKIGSIINNPKRISGEFKGNFHIIDLPKCSKCKTSYKHKENSFGLCKSCLKEELIENIFLLYVDSFEKGNYKRNFEKEFNSCLSKTKCNIGFQINISLGTAIRNSEYQFKDLFYEIRKSMCLFCVKSIEDKYYLELPCSCKICSKACFDKYMQIVEGKNKIMYIDKKKDDIIIKPLTECHCGFKYNMKAFINLINKMEELEEEDYKEIYQMQIKNNWKWVCMVCRQYFNNKNENYRLFLQDNQINKKILKKFELKHLICESCAKKNKIDKLENGERKINCTFCQSEHKIESIKKVNSSNMTESSCIII